MRFHRLKTVLSALLVSAFVSFALAADSTGSITLSGTVSNSATGNLLEGARIEVPRLGISALTDSTGRFVIHQLPAGTHEMVTSYIGLDPQHTNVTVTAGQRAERNFELTSNVYILD